MSDDPADFGRYPGGPLDGADAEATTGDVLLAAAEELAGPISLITGIKAQFVADGWSAPHAEAAAIALYRGLTGQRG